jgi:hypothetical protein
MDWICWSDIQPAGVGSEAIAGGLPVHVHAQDEEGDQVTATALLTPDDAAYWGLTVQDCLLCLAQQPTHECATLWADNAYLHARRAARLALATIAKETK